MSARELVYRDDPTGAAVMWACSTCGRVHTPSMYGHDADAAKAHAETCLECIGHSVCRDCGAEAPKYHSYCIPCERVHRRRSHLDQAAKAAEDDTIEECFGLHSDFYRSIDEARDGGEIVVFGADFEHFAFDLERITTSMLEEHHEDAGVADLEGYGRFEDAVNVFNAEQTSGSYHIDQTRKRTIMQTRTFAIIKPDATLRGIQETMITDIEDAGFRVLGRQDRTMTRDEAEWLYREHAERAHFPDLVAYTISAPVVMLLLESDEQDTPTAFRGLMGPTDRTKAGPDTLRGRYAVGLRENSVHGSDSPKAAIAEIARFFPETPAG